MSRIALVAPPTKANGDGGRSGIGTDSNSSSVRSGGCHGDGGQQPRAPPPPPPPYHTVYKICDYGLSKLLDPTGGAVRATIFGGCGGAAAAARHNGCASPGGGLPPLPTRP